jgi:hypothetical protein
VRGQNHSRALINRELNRGDGRRDARVVGDLAVFERDVEINTNENPLPRQVEVARADDAFYLVGMNGLK